MTNSNSIYAIGAKIQSVCSSVALKANTLIQPCVNSLKKHEGLLKFAAAIGIAIAVTASLQLFPILAFPIFLGAFVALYAVPEIYIKSRDFISNVVPSLVTADSKDLSDADVVAFIERLRV